MFCGEGGKAARGCRARSPDRQVSLRKAARMHRRVRAARGQSERGIKHGKRSRVRLRRRPKNVCTQVWVQPAHPNVRICTKLFEVDEKFEIKPSALNSRGGARPSFYSRGSFYGCNRRPPDIEIFRDLGAPAGLGGWSASERRQRFERKRLCAAVKRLSSRCNRPSRCSSSRRNRPSRGSAFQCRRMRPRRRGLRREERG
jgi:hypothetical protein